MPETTTFFSNTTVDTHIYVIVFIIVGLIVLTATVGVHYYKRFKKMRQFKEELEQLDLGETGENTFVDLIKRYALNEPVDVLMSVKLFDDMAMQEINRILGSSGSMTSKQQFVNMIYDIRQKTYFPEYSESDDEIEDKENTPSNSMENEPVTA